MCLCWVWWGDIVSLNRRDPYNICLLNFFPTSILGIEYNEGNKVSGKEDCVSVSLCACECISLCLFVCLCVCVCTCVCCHAFTNYKGPDYAFFMSFYTIKKAEHWRIVAFELWFWKRLLRVPWTARRSNQSILKEISPDYSLEGLLLKLKHQYFGHLMQRTDSLEKTLMLGKIKGRRRRGWQKMVWADSRSWWWTGKPGELQSIGSQRVGHDWATELTDWCLF